MNPDLFELCYGGYYKDPIEKELKEIREEIEKEREEEKNEKISQ